MAASHWANIEQYLTDPARGLLLQIGIFVTLVLLLAEARHYIRRWAVAGQGSSFTATVFDYPVAAALLAALLAGSSPSLMSTSPTVRNLFLVLAVAPMIQLTRPVVDPRIVPELYALGVLYALDTLRQAFGGTLLVEQLLLLLEALAGAVVLGGSLLFGGLRRSHDYHSATGRVRLGELRLGAGFVLFALVIALAASALGYLSLARLLVSAIFGGGVVALTLAATVRVLAGMTAFALRVRPLRYLHLVRHHRPQLERHAYRLLVWLAAGGWLIHWLDYIGLFESAFAFTETLLSVRLERGAISLSLGDVAAFIVSVWTAYQLSVVIRCVLQEDVYPRKGVPPGSSYAISSLLHYLILVLGFVIGLGLLGVDLGKLGILAGAFGVGIGFGLQGIVNNFVSGLILLFERLLHVGDTVELGELLGEVRRIGIRSSTVHTWRGADIIVPNAQFVTEQVTNWTLSDRHRRIDLPVSVNYGAVPRTVIGLLEAAARAQPHILQQPPPQGFLLGYGDSAINFELWAWTDRFEDWPRIRSDLASAIYDAVYAAGLSFPFPQRKVRLLGDPVAGVEHVAGSAKVAEDDRKIGN